ncbi:unnamed protein product [Rhizoctonia solani]|uniref:Uncharacterized protein n=1 Tax=Rhizoctonia solani TaxID=456999 RepID=A0A8H3GC78_9AGAM|nr:unnamed protein product [Rhizoctonia solani]
MEQAMTEVTQYQSSPNTPWPETELTEEEQIQWVSRVLHLFEFRRNGALVTMPIGASEPAYKEIAVVGIVGTLVGKAGLFSQCGWFGNYDLDWFWCQITDIRTVELRSDIRFRGGAECVWMSTSQGDYALLLPRAAYTEMWEASLRSHRSEAGSVHTSVWPTQGTRPDWWDPHLRESWPWDKDPDAMEVEEDQQMGAEWMRFGPRGDTRFPGEPLSHLHALLPWVISPNGLKYTLKK